MGGLMPVRGILGRRRGTGTGGVGGAVAAARAFLRHRNLSTAEYRDGEWRGALIGYSRATAEWTLATRVPAAVTPAEAVVGSATAGMTVKLPTLLATGAAGNGWTFNFGVSSSLAIAYNPDARTLTLSHNGHTWTQIAARLNGQFGAGTAVAVGGAGVAPTSITPVVFAGGADAESVGAEVDDPNKVLTVLHNTADQFSAIVASINGVKVAEGTISAHLIHGTSATGRPSDPPQTGIRFIY